MKTAKVLACCLLAFPLVGTGPRTVRISRAKTLTSPRQRSIRREAIEALKRQGETLLRAARYFDAQKVFESARDAAIQSKEFDLAARSANNIGLCHYLSHQYRSAFSSYMEATRLAAKGGDATIAGAIEANLASLNGEMGQADSAAHSLTNWFNGLGEEEKRKRLPAVQIQLAVWRASQQRWTESLDLFRKGIAGADRSGDRQLYATGWNRLGQELLNKGNLRLAERAVLESYRVRKLGGLAGLDLCYRNLGVLRLRRNDLEAASALLNQAVELASRPQAQVPLWDVYHWRGEVRLRQGRLADSLTDLRAAIRLGRAWRWEGLPGDASRITAEVWLSKVHSALIEAGNRLYLQTGDPALVRETFEAAEENHAASLRMSLAEHDAEPADLAPEYWLALRKLQRLETKALRADVSPAALEAGREAVSRMEAQMLPAAKPWPRDIMRQTQVALDADTALLSLHAGESISWLWAVDRSGIALYALPPRKQILAQVKEASDAIRANSSDEIPQSAKLYQTLFAPLASRFLRKERWLLALDEAQPLDRRLSEHISLFDLPFAALVTQTGRRLAYLAERHTTEVIPGAGYWLDSAARRRDANRSKLLVALGDPIYNNADPRLQKPARPTGFFRVAPVFAAGQAIMLPRLVASATELNVCARAWKGDTVKLEGAEASAERVKAELAEGPAVAHFATHFLQSAGNGAEAQIALSLTAKGESQSLSAAEIGKWKAPVNLVVLSGCHSAAGQVLPGAGMMGLTRAWLTAGAQSVLGSRWTTPDEEGNLFRDFYRNLGSSNGQFADRALRAAQLAMIRSGGWRARPSYWGAFYVVANR